MGTPRYAGQNVSQWQRLVKEADDLACDVLSSRLLVIHDAGGRGEDDVAKLTRWQELDNPLLHVTELNVVARADDTGLVEAVERSQDMDTLLQEGPVLTVRSAE